MIENSHWGGLLRHRLVQGSVWLSLVAAISLPQAALASYPDVSPGRFIGSLEIPSLHDRINGAPDADKARSGPIILRRGPDLKSPSEVEISQAGQLESIEHGYGTISAIVDARTNLRDGTWYKVRYSLSGRTGTGWVSPKDGGHFRHLPELIRGLTYLTPDWDGRLYETPRRDQPSRQLSGLPERPNAWIANFDWNKDEVWALVVISRGSLCSGELADLAVVATGWVPVFSKSGKLMIWFYSRGC